MATILVTGHLGLIGRHLAPLLRAGGHEVRGFDLADGSGDITRHDALAEAVRGCGGIVHLAAVSRVLWAERDPERCRATNAEASRALAGMALAEGARGTSGRPWLLAASSREVYGQPERLPVREDAPLAPVNVYGRSKAALEAAVREAGEAGLVTGIVRFSNVYGSALDHPDRVLPAFCRAAAEGTALRVDGEDTLFDFTHVRDVVRGLMGMIGLLEAGRSLPPLHLVSGRGTGLCEAAALATGAAGSGAEIRMAPPRENDVSRFVGDPGRAAEVLGWSAEVALEDGIADLVAQFRRLAGGAEAG